MQIFDITIAPGATHIINGKASFIYFLSGSAGGADNTIAVRNETGSDTILLKPGQAFRLPMGQTYERWIISNHAGQGTIIGTVTMGAGEFFDNRISGSVEVIDGGKNRTMADLAFMGGVYTGPVVNTGHGQLWNPAASGKNIVVESVSFTGSSTADTVGLFPSTSVLSTLYGTPRNKKIASAGASVARTYYRDNVGSLAVGNAFCSLPHGQSIKFNEPIVLTPGTGLLLVQNTSGNVILASFEYYEDGV